LHEKQDVQIRTGAGTRSPAPRKVFLSVTGQNAFPMTEAVRAGSEGCFTAAGASGQRVPGNNGRKVADSRL